MSKKRRSKTADYLVYLVLRVFVCVMQALSFETACRFASFLGWLIYKIDKRHRQVAIENLQKAFPGKYTDEQIDTIVRQVYEHICVMVFEVMHMPRRWHLHNYKQMSTLHDSRRMVEVLMSGRPVLFVTGHFGNWEVAGMALGLVGFRSHAIARPLDNPYVDDFLRSYRERTGQKLLAKQGDFANIEAILKNGGILATLADQDAGLRGLFVDFFGRPASTHKAVALLALEHNVPMVVLGAPQVDGMYRLWGIDVIFPEDYANARDPVKEITQRFTTGLEALIRETPEQYFWVHRRWKHAPPERRKKAKTQDPGGNPKSSAA